jgi:hypothetical protein
MGGRSILRSIPLSGLLRSAAGSGGRGCFLGACSSRGSGRYYRTSTHVHTPLHNPRPLAEDTLPDIEVIDPAHPLFGRRFPRLSSHPQPLTATHVFVTYQGSMVLRLPRAATNLLPPSSQVPTTLTSHAIIELISLAEQCEVLCRTTPAPSGTRSVPHSRPTSAPSSRPSSRR